MISASPWGPKFMTFLPVLLTNKVYHTNIAYQFNDSLSSRIHEILKKYPPLIPKEYHLLNKLNYKARSFVQISITNILKYVFHRFIREAILYFEVLSGHY